MTLLSYVSGASDKPLLGVSIGEALRDAARTFGERNAITSRFQNEALSYRELDEAADRVAASLLAMGVERGERVGIWSQNRIEWLITHHGAVRIGAIVVTINPALRSEEAHYVLQDSETNFLFASPSYRSFSFANALNEIRDRLHAIRQIVLFGEERHSSDFLLWEDFIARGSNIGATAVAKVERKVTFEDNCGIQYTSGTTGRPKGALLTHHNLLNNGYFVGVRQNLNPNDIICLPVPFFHCFGIGLGALAALTHGSSLVLPGESFDPLSCLQAIEENKCTSFYGVPMMYIAILNHSDLKQYDLTSLRTGCMGGAPCPIETMKKAVSLMHMSGITVCYGMTETSPISFQSVVQDNNETRCSTIGMIHPHIEAKIIDPSTLAIVLRGISGELCVRGYSVMREYWKNEPATRLAIDERRWMHTGDLALMREDGYVQIVGRIKDTVIRGGENIYPREVEEFLLTLDPVAEAYVFGIPDEKYGEELCVWLRPKPGIVFQESDLRPLCYGRIANYKIPRFVRIVDSFPMTASGKVQRFRMREIELSSRENAVVDDNIA